MPISAKWAPFSYSQVILQRKHENEERIHTLTFIIASDAGHNCAIVVLSLMYHGSLS